MSTVLGFPDASTVATTDLFWITQGSGADRDKKATVAQVAAAGLPSAVGALGAPGAMADTQELAVLQGVDLRKTTIKNVVDTAASGAPGGGDYSTSNVLVEQGGSMVKYEMRQMQGQGVDFAKNTTNPPVWTGAATSAWATVVDSGHIRLIRHKSAIGQDTGLYTLDIFVRFAAVSGASSDTAFVTLSLPEAAFPSGWFDDLDVITTMGAFNCRTTARIQKSDAAEYAETTETVHIEPSVGAIQFVLPSVRWQHLMPDNSSGAILHISHTFIPDLPAALP